MKKQIKEMVWFIFMALTMGLGFYFGGQIAEKIWPRKPIEFNENVSVYHSYTFNSTVQEWEEASKVITD